MNVIVKFNEMMGIVFENGLVKVAKGMFNRVETSELCIGQTCVNEDDLKAFLQQNGTQVQSIAAPPSTSTLTPELSPEPTSEPTPSPSESPILSSEPSLELRPEPTPSQESVPEISPNL